MTQKKHWQSYEEVAAHLLNQLSDHFGVGRFEGKQVVPGESETNWELDAKGCSDGNGRIVVVECKPKWQAGYTVPAKKMYRQAQDVSTGF